MLCSPASLAQPSPELAKSPWYARGICPGNQRPRGQVWLFPGNSWLLQEISQCPSPPRQTWGVIPLPGFPVVFGMASLIGGSNLRHKNPESHLLVRSLVPTQEKVPTAASQSGVEDAAQRSSDLQLRTLATITLACQSEGTHIG